MQYITEQNQVPVLGSFDVVVSGGGVAGVAAALSARRAGKSVLLLEKSVTLGGLATLGLINYIEPLCNGRGVQIMRGMAQEFLDLAVRYGFDTIPPEWKDGLPDGPAQARYVTRYSPNLCAIALAKLLMDEGVDMLLDTLAVKPVMEGGHCRGVTVENKTGRGFYACRVVIDATGDADLLFRAGVPTVQGKNYFSYSAKQISLESCKKAVETGRINDAITPVRGGGALLSGKNQPEGRRLYGGVTAQDVTEYVLDNQMILLDRLKDDERFSRELVTLPGMAQFRTTRRIDGDYTLKPEDAYRHFDDSVCAISDFTHRDLLYEVPYRCLINQGFGNLLTAGRCASGTGWAWDVLRVIPPAILTGQAAGLAAAHAIDEGCAVSGVNIQRLQGALAKSDVLIHFDDSLIPAKTE